MSQSEPRPLRGARRICDLARLAKLDLCTFYGIRPPLLWACLPRAPDPGQAVPPTPVAPTARPDDSIPAPRHLPSPPSFPILPSDSPVCRDLNPILNRPLDEHDQSSAALKARDVEAIIARHPEIDIRSIQLYIAHHGVQQCYTSQNPDSGNVTLWIEMYRNFTDLDDWLEIVVHAYPRFRPNFEASRRPGEDQATFLKRLGYDARAADKNDGETLRNEAKKIEAVFRFFFSIAAMSPDRLQRYAVPCIENLLSAEPVTYDLAFIARDFLRTCGERMKQVDSERLGKIIEVMRRRIQKVTGDPMLRFLNMPATRINQAATQLGFPPPPGWAPAK